MLVHHFEDPEKSHFLKETFFEGVPTFSPIQSKGREYSDAYHY